jgi:16S rRNA A1518/A1519 N6-dimethyltransferase RsmA/KsgA/DIM1 with predicted DNA glycosylase/AP lyase activity
MALTKNMIDKHRFVERMEIDPELEPRLLGRFGEEPHRETYSEQDLHEQVREYASYYNEGKETVLIIS